MMPLPSFSAVDIARGVSGAAARQTNTHASRPTASRRANPSGGWYEAVPWPRPIDLPHFLTTSLILCRIESIGEHRLFGEQGGEPCDHWDQLLLRHHGHDIITQASWWNSTWVRCLVVFGGVGLEQAMITKHADSDPEQCQQCHGRRVLPMDILLSGRDVTDLALPFARWLE